VKNNLVESNINLVRACVSRFLGKGIEYDDIFQAGCLGLVKAARKFDCTRGTKFSTCAVPFILGEIKCLFRENNQLKVSRSLKDLFNKIRYEREIFIKNNNRDPSLSELANTLGVTVEKIVEALNSSQYVFSIDENEGFREIFSDSHEKLLSEQISVRDAILSLNDLDKKIIQMRFFQFKTQLDSAKCLGMTQVQISRMEKKILKKLRTKLI